MKFYFILFFICILYYAPAIGQNSDGQNEIDTALSKKITVSGFCLCKTTLADLKKLDPALEAIDVEEMDMCKDGFTTDARFENRKGYYSKQYPGIIFQKDMDNDFISKIRLTKDFVGQLPDGSSINMHTLLAKDVLAMYPKFDTWGSRGCSDYWSLSNDTLAFFVKINKNKQPQYPVDEAYYSNQPVAGIDLVVACYSLSHQSSKLVLFPPDEPMLFLDSIRINEGVLKSYDPNEIALINVYKYDNTITPVEKDAKNGVIYITTKAFARDAYSAYFKSKSQDYERLVPDLKTELNVVYILNNKVLTTNFEGDLFSINNSNFISLSVINSSRLKADYHISNKTIGVVIQTKAKP